MRRICFTLASAVLLLLIIGSTASAVVRERGDTFYHGIAPAKAPPPTPKAPPQTVGTKGKATVHSNFTGKKCAKGVCRYYKSGKLVKRCVTVGRRTTCTSYDAKGRATRVCVRKRPGGTFKCHKVNRASFAFARGFDANRDNSKAWLPGSKVIRSNRAFQGLAAQGFGNIPAVGALYFDGRQMCSGSLIARGIVLTAGHCLYEHDGTGFGDVNFAFVPGQTWIDGYVGLASGPIGSFAASRVWVTPGWVDGDYGVDWGMIELAPNSAGYYPGDYQGVGNFAAQSNIQYSVGAHVYLAGYPGEGIFGYDDLHNGVGQYYCDTTWDGYSSPPGTVTENWAVTGSNYFLGHQCTMNGGSSGGPVFVQLSDNSWVIGGVVNQGTVCCGAARTDTTRWYSNWVTTAWFDGRIIDLWNQATAG